jgi:hypothetical protein
VAKVKGPATIELLSTLEGIRELRVQLYNAFAAYEQLDRDSVAALKGCGTELARAEKLVLEVLEFRKLDELREHGARLERLLVGDTHRTNGDDESFDDLALPKSH